MGELLFVKHRSEAWTRGHGEAAVMFDMHTLGEEEVAALDRPAWRIEWKLDEGAAANPGGHMQVGQHAKPVGPCVWCEPAVLEQSQLCEEPRPRHPDRQHDVGLIDIE